MATLFDVLQQRLQNQQAAPQQPQQQQVASVLRAKGGKAGGGAAPAASSLGEASAISANAPSAVPGALAAGQVAGAVEEQRVGTSLAEEGLASQRRMAESGLAAKGTMAREQLAGQTDIAAQQRASQEALKTNAINAQATNQLRNLSTARGVTLDNVFADFQQSGQELEFRRDAAQLEQLGFELAMSDKAYLDELTRIGRERGLYDDAAFRDEMSTIVLGGNLRDALDQLDFEKAYNGDVREWEKQLTEMGADAKIDLAKAMIADDQKQAIATGIGSAAGAAAPYAVAYASKPTPTTSVGGSSGSASSGTTVKRMPVEE